MYFFLFNRTTLQVFLAYLTGALYVPPLWFYKYQHEKRVRSKLFVACQRWWFQWRFWFVPSVPGEMHNYCTPHIIIENVENFLIHRCNYEYILLSQVYLYDKLLKPRQSFWISLYFGTCAIVGVSYEVEEHLASQEGLCCTELSS